MSVIITTRTRSMTGSYVFTGVSLRAGGTEGHTEGLPGFSTIYGRSIWSSNGEGLRYG